MCPFSKRESILFKMMLYFFWIDLNTYTFFILVLYNFTPYFHFIGTILKTKSIHFLWRVFKGLFLQAEILWGLKLSLKFNRD
jgi:hypothetical protein